MYRTGFGIDFHQLVEGRPLWIGGVQIPHYKGALGHSDADVLLHAICDALLGALALGDIGEHFPNHDPAYKDIDSKILLEKPISWSGKKLQHSQYRFYCLPRNAEDKKVCAGYARGDRDNSAGIG